MYAAKLNLSRFLNFYYISIIAYFLIVAIQQTTKGHHSILDSILPLPPYYHQKDQENPSIPRRHSNKFIRDYPSGPTYQNDDHTSSSPHSQRRL